MSNIEKSRSNLQISGYVHPDEVQHANTIPVYKSFNTESKKDDYISSKPKSVYATFTDKESLEKINCPQCKGEAMYECNCELKDKQCSKGHVWYVDNKGVVKQEDPHEDE